MYECFYHNLAISSMRALYFLIPSVILISHPRKHTHTHTETVDAATEKAAEQELVSAADHLRAELGEGGGGGVYKQDSVRGRERVYPDESDEVEAGGVNFKSNAKERKQQRRMRVLSKAIRMFPHPSFFGNLRTDFVF